MSEDLTPREALAAALRHAFPFRRRVDDELSADMILASLPPGWTLTYDPDAARPDRAASRVSGVGVPTQRAVTEGRRGRSRGPRER